MADLNVTASFQSVVDLKKELGDLAPLYAKVVNRIETDSKRLTKALNAPEDANLAAKVAVNTAKLQEYLGVAGKRIALMKRSEDAAARQAKAEAEVTRQLIAQSNAAEQAAAANARKAQRTINSNIGFGSVGIDASASAKAYSNEIERLRLKFDQVYASSQIYERSLNELNTAHLLGVTSTKQHEAAIESLNAEYQQFQSGAVNSLNRFGNAAQQTGRQTNQLGVVVQQTGYQVGDFLVQIQSGTNPMVAFGQQATQLVGVLPLLSTSLGVSVSTLIGFSTGLGIAIPLITAIGAAYMRTSEAENIATEGAKKLKEAHENLASALYKTQIELDKISLGVEESYQVEILREQVSLRKDYNTELQKYREMQAYNSKLDIDAQQMYSAELTNQANILDLTAQKLSSNSDALKQEENLAKQLTQAQLAIANAKSLQIVKANTLLTVTNLQSIATAQVSSAAQKIVTGLTEAGIRGKYLAERAGEAGVKASQLSQISFSNLAAASTEALRLAGNLGIALDTATKLAGLGPQGIGGNDPSGKTYSGRGEGPSQGDLVDIRLAGQLGYRTPPSGSSGGSGGGGSSASNDKLDALVESLRTEKEVVDAWYVESQASLNSANASELAIIGGANEAKLRLAEEYAKRLSDIKEASNKFSLQSALEGGAEIFGALGAFNKKFLKAQAIFSAGSALISTYQGAAKELAKGTLGFAGAAAVIAKGIAFVAAIKGAGNGGTSAAGGGGGAGPGVSTVEPSTGSPSPQTVYVNSLDPAGLYSGQTMINLFEAFYDENDKRGKVFVVAR